MLFSLITISPTFLWLPSGNQTWLAGKSTIYIVRWFPMNTSIFWGIFNYWLVVSTPLKNISQMGVLFPIYGKIKHVPNHQPDCHVWWHQRLLRHRSSGSWDTRSHRWWICTPSLGSVRMWPSVAMSQNPTVPKRSPKIAGGTKDVNSSFDPSPCGLNQ